MSIQIALKVLFVICIVTALIELKWLISEHAFDHKGNDTMLETVVELFQRVVTHGMKNATLMLARLRATELWDKVSKIEL